MMRSWTIHDFFVRGDFCPQEHLKQGLRAIGQVLNAEGVILLVAYENRLFGTLMICSGRNTALMHSLEDHLQEHRTAALKQAGAPNAVDQIFAAISDARNFGELCDGLRIPQHGSQASRPGVGLRRDYCRLRTALYVIGEGLPRDVGQRIDEEWNVLEAHVCCTVQYFMRERYVLESSCDTSAYRSEKALESNAALLAMPSDPQPSRVWALLPEKSLCRAFLELIADQTQSIHVSLYGLLRDSPGLDMAPFVAIGQELGDSAQNHRLEVLQEAFKSKQPFVRFTRGEGHRLIQLAFPLSYRRFNTKSIEAMGVLYLQASRATKGPFYTSRDIEIMRAVAMHLRRHHDWLLLRQTAELLGGIARPTDTIEVSKSMDWRVHVDFGDDLPIQDGRSLTSVLPIESGQCSRSIVAAMGGLYKLTRARSVELRMLTTDSKFLVRCVNLYGNVNADGKIEHLQSDYPDSADAWCARHAEPCDIPSVGAGNFGAKHRGLRSITSNGEDGPLASLYCAPIWCQGRVIGTLSVKSVYNAAFTTAHNLVNAVAAQIGALVENARFANEALLTVSSPMVDTVHNLQKLQKEVKLIGREELRSRKLWNQLDTIETIANNIAFDLRGIDFAGVDASISERSTVREVLEAYRDERQLINARIVETRELDLRPVESDSKLRALLKCLHEIMQNARDYAGTGDNQPTIRVATAYYGGARWLLITIKNTKNRQEGEFSKRDIALFGRRPIERADAVHWGALLAGATVRRQLGGELYLEDLQPGMFCVTIGVPLPEQEQEELA